MVTRMLRVAISPMRWLGVVLMVAAVLGLPAMAQSVSTAQLNGTVRDPAGAVVVGAAITVADASKGFSRSTVSDGQGNYQLLLLPPGSAPV